MPARRGWTPWAVLLVSLGLVSIAIVGSFASGPTAPSESGPTGFDFGNGLAAYDPPGGYVVWLLADGSTWTSDHGSWSNITASAGVPTNMEESSQLTYDARDGYLLLFGGEVPVYRPVFHTAYLGDTWIFSQGRWANFTSMVHGAPPPGVPGLMTYDSEDREVVMFGGAPTNGSELGNSTNTTWTYAAGVWTSSTVPAPPPYSRSGGADPFVGFTDDPTDGFVLYYNVLGYRCLGQCPTIWSFRAGVWTNQTTEFSPFPDLTYFDAFTFDSTAGVVLAEAQCVSKADYSCGHSYGTFVFSHNRWTDVTPSVVSAFRELNGYSNDPTVGGVIIAGGCCWADFSGLSLGWQDSWAYSNGTWTESTPWGGTSPSWIQYDGIWASLAVAVAVAGIAVSVVRARAPPAP